MMEVKYGLFSLIISTLVCHVLSISERQLLLGYDRALSLNIKHIVTIDFFYQNLIHFDVTHGMILSGVFTLEWYDEQLTWNNSDRKSNTTGKIFGKYGRRGMLIDINKIWSPSIYLSNSKSGIKIDGQSEDRKNEQAYVSMNGHVIWMPFAVLDPFCPSTDHDSYSYHQRCVFYMIELAPNLDVLGFKLKRHNIHGDKLVNNYWDVCSITSSVGSLKIFDSTYRTVFYTMYLEYKVSEIGFIDFISRIVLITLISSCSVFVFKMPADPASRIELISIVLIVTNIFDTSTLETSYMKSFYNILLCVNVVISVALIIIVLGILKIPYDSICSQSRNAEMTTERIYTIQQRISMDLTLVRLSRRAHRLPDREQDADEEINGTSENRENGQFENELFDEERRYDGRNFVLFSVIYFTVFLVCYVTYAIVSSKGSRKGCRR